MKSMYVCMKLSEKRGWLCQCVADSGKCQEMLNILLFKLLCPSVPLPLITRQTVPFVNGSVW